MINQKEKLQVRVAILKSVSIFSQSDEESLEKIASVVTDMWFEPEQNVFEKGETGSSLYIIVSGKVRVHDGEYTFATLGERQVFGEYSLLDTEARSASITAVDKTHLLRLDQHDFYEIMASQINVTKGILKECIKRMRYQNNLEEKLALSNKEIQQQRDEIAHKNALLEKKNRDITASINYAKRIQTSVMPDAEKLSQIFSEAFILFKPRDIVSGDFYWFYKIDDHRSVVAIADCTGHGVPGALMSIAGNAYLNQIVKFQCIYSPDQILNELHKNIKEGLNQDETENKDGMDITICFLDTKKGILEFAGAKNPLVYIQNNELFHIKGDKFSIGGHQFAEVQLFTKHTVELTSTTTFYLFSDGYQDQFGGSENRKFMVRKLKDLLLELHHHPMDFQHQELERIFVEWKGETDQIDDVLIAGFKVGK